MAFQVKDETAGRYLLWVDNAGQVGLGSLPISGSRIAVMGASILSSAIRFADGTLRPGVPSVYYGTMTVPANGTASVSVSTAAAPTVTSTVDTSSVTSSNITFNNSQAYSVTNNYSAW